MKILVIVRNGVVSSVTCSKEADVTVVDFDDVEIGSDTPVFFGEDDFEITMDDVQREINEL